MKIVAHGCRCYFNTQKTLQHGKQTQLVVNFTSLRDLL